MIDPFSFFDCQLDELKTWCSQQGFPSYLPQQLCQWVYERGVVDPSLMTNISLQNRQQLADHIRFYTGTVLSSQTASDGTEKLLLSWDDDKSTASNESTEQKAWQGTECVMIPTDARRTVCVSSQIGCPVGCRFCASGINGLNGQLTAGQIVQQVHRLQFSSDARRISNVVFMGMGEPLANLEAVTRAIRILNASWGFGISARRITVSTVGLPSAIRKFSQFELPVTLALSLHAPNDQLRRQLIPWAEYATIDEILDACDGYFTKTGREITLEYLLLRGVNDQLEHAEQLAGIARKIRANVNLIRFNEVKGIPFDRPTSDDVYAFQNTLRQHGINTHLRASRGRDIAAACGQLRLEQANR